MIGLLKWPKVQISMMYRAKCLCKSICHIFEDVLKTNIPFNIEHAELFKILKKPESKDIWKLIEVYHPA